MKVIVASNRLPIQLSFHHDRVEINTSAGGLASGLKSVFATLKTRDAVWVGWHGATDLSPANALRADIVGRENNYSFIHLSQQLVDNYYKGFCNSLLYPLFTSFPEYTDTNIDDWNAYKCVNELFCDEIVKIADPGDLVWVHDYHLLLLPAMLRKKLPHCFISFFLHIPFPKPAAFNCVPYAWRNELLHGIVGADLVAFQTKEYTSNFSNCLIENCGIQVHDERLYIDCRVAFVHSFPIGIDFDRFHQKAIDVFADNIKHDERIVLSIDRLDYAKGIPNKLLAFKTFLILHPKWMKKCKLLVVAVPSRGDLQVYVELKKQIEELVDQINKELGSTSWTPVEYSNEFLEFEKLVSLYTVSDVALVTPLHDGMNLVCKEYIASRVDNRGVLILSNTAGACCQLTDALIVDPMNQFEVSNSIHRALEMSGREQFMRLRRLQQVIRESDIYRWADQLTTPGGIVNQYKNEAFTLG